MKTIIIVTAYGEDNYYQKKRYEDVIGLYSSVKKAIRGAKSDGLTNSQIDYLNKINAFYCLDEAIRKNKVGETFQVDYEEETDKRRKPCTSSYMFRTYYVD